MSSVPSQSHNYNKEYNCSFCPSEKQHILEKWFIFLHLWQCRPAAGHESGVCQILELPTRCSSLRLLSFAVYFIHFSTLLPSSFKLFMCCLLVSTKQAAYNVFSKLCSLTINLSFENRSLSPSTNMDVIHDSSLSLRSQFLVIPVGLRCLKVSGAQ